MLISNSEVYLHAASFWVTRWLLVSMEKLVLCSDGGQSFTVWTLLLWPLASSGHSWALVPMQESF